VNNGVRAFRQSKSERNDSVTEHALFDNHIVQDVSVITWSWQSLRVWKEKYDVVRQMWYTVSVRALLGGMGICVIAILSEVSTWSGVSHVLPIL